MPKKSEKSATTTPSVTLPRDLQTKWMDATIELKQAQVASAKATKKIDEVALEILQRKYATTGSQTEAVLTPKRLRDCNAEELLRPLGVVSDLEALKKRKEAKREKKADARAATKKEDEQQRIDEEPKVGTKEENGVDVHPLKHEDHNPDERRSHNEDRAVSEDRRSLPRPGRTPPRLPRKRTPSKSPERDAQWKADVITSRIRHARATTRSPSRETLDEARDRRNHRDDRSRSRSLAPGEQRRTASPVAKTQRRRRPTPATGDHHRRNRTPTPDRHRRQPRSPIPDEQRRRHPPPSPKDGKDALKDEKPEGELPRADEEDVLEIGEDEAPPVLEKCAEMGEAMLEEGEIGEEKEEKESMHVVVPSKKPAEDNPLEAGRTHRKRTSPEKPKSPKKKRIKSDELVHDSSDSEADEGKKRKDKRKKKSKSGEKDKVKTGDEKSDADEAGRRHANPNDGGDERKNESGEVKKDEPKEAPDVIRGRTPSRSPSRSPSPPDEKPKNEDKEDEKEGDAKTDAVSGSSSSSDSSSDSSSSSSGSESEGEEGKK